MTKRKMAVIYDASYLMGGGESVKKLIMSRRFSSTKSSGVFGALLAKVVGKGSGTVQTVAHEAGDLFVVSEVIPTEVMKQVERDATRKEKGQQAIATLLNEGAIKVDLALDTVVGDQDFGSHPGRKVAPDAAELDRQAAEKLLRYALRVVSFRTSENYDFAVVATEGAGLLQSIAEARQRQKAVVGVSSQLLTGARVLPDALTDLANWDKASKLKMET